jgi:hypothetical protein
MGTDICQTTFRRACTAGRPRCHSRLDGVQDVGGTEQVVVGQPRKTSPAALPTGHVLVHPARASTDDTWAECVRIVGLSIRLGRRRP